MYEVGQNNETVLQTTINYVHSATDKLSAKGYELGQQIFILPIHLILY